MKHPLDIWSCPAAVTAWSRTMIERGAVIVDTETTDLDGVAIELAAVDVDGAVIVNTLIAPLAPISEGARAIHGISDAELIGAPSWARVAEQLGAAVGERPLLAYNAEFDYRICVATARAAGRALPPALTDLNRWGCLMRARAAYEGGKWKRLQGGNHRALGDARAAREQLLLLADRD